MLCLHFSLQPSDPSRFARLVESRRFLGDVFHGWLKRTLRDCAPGVYSALRPSESGPALYTLFCAHETSGDGDLLNVRVVLLGSATACANDLLTFLMAADTIDLGPPHCVLVPQTFEVSKPGNKPISLLDTETGLYEAMPDDWLEAASVTQLPSVANQSIESLGLKVLSAMRIGQLPASAVPSMLQIAKVLLRKISDCEPQTTVYLQVETAEWFEQVKALKSCELKAAEIIESAWTYQSENQATHTRSGWVGLVQYEGSIGPQVLQLLWLGQWLGLGQNTSGGQGAYQLTIG
jgi:CRISPR-associated endoribonuclease Cas6